MNLQTTQKFRTLHTQTVAVTVNHNKVVAQNRVIMGVIAAVVVAMAERHLYKRKSNKTQGNEQNLKLNLVIV